MSIIYIIKDCYTNDIEAIFSIEEKAKNHISIIDPNNDWTMMEAHIIN